MKKFIICTDSACDLSSEVLKELNVECVDLTFTYEGETTRNTGKDIIVKDFYESMRNGAAAKTSAINPEEFKDFFEPFIKEGNDVLYLAFSSGLSTTYNSARIAAEELMDTYKENKIMVVDTLCASAGQGLIVYLTAKKQQDGATLEETADYVENTKMSICHWFTVDDLVYLKRGGRISPTVALVGSVLGIKPVLHVDNEGHLISHSKVKGRKNSILALYQKYKETATQNTVFISHADCLTDAQFLAEQLKELGADVKITTDIGPVIGAHAGPGTLALFFVGKER